MLKILFRLRESKNKPAKATIYCRIIVDGVRATDFSTGISCKCETPATTVSASDVKSKYLAHDEVTLEELQRKFLAKESVGKTEATIKIYRKYLAKIRDYVPREEILAKQLDVRFIEGYKRYLERLGDDINYVARCLKFVKQLSRFGLREGLLEQDKIETVQVKTVKKEIQYLTENEFLAIKSRKFDIERIQNTDVRYATAQSGY